MFDKILIANRGEIACRILKTARRLGIRTVAVYSDADARARHVRLADEAWYIGASDARSSYLSIGCIIDACRKSGAQAVHPGYGFLSENADFAQACEAAGLVFIGPPPGAIRAMGSKSAARARMEQAGVPVAPGYHGERQDADFLQAQADSIGYPVLLKPVAGGGGKGMRVVQESDIGQAGDGKFADILAACQREALSSFGDGRVLIEKYLACARHIEIQIFADTHGNVIHLFERDCSVQRRHQKVLEEAPAPGMTSARRAAMGEAALLAARSAGYVGAGTVEFIVDAASPDGAFYFMEMNTRLQVEHPVTEMITGLDLVEWQLRVAAGEPLPMTQEAVRINGHAIEARICAEDPARDFLPAPGRLLHLALPGEGAACRIDRGVDAGDMIPPFYDPMIAKLIVVGTTRDEALMRLRAALAQCQLLGLASNISFLSRLAACPPFRRGAHDTRLIDREGSGLLSPASLLPSDEVWLLAALAKVLPAASGECGNDPWHCQDGWRLTGKAPHRCHFRHESLARNRTVFLTRQDQGFRLELDGQHRFARAEWQSENHLSAQIDGHHLQASIVFDEARCHVWFEGEAHVFVCVDPLQGHGAVSGAEHRLTSPMPGKVVALLVRPGERVKAAAPLLILEAMKMETTIRAPADGLVRSFPHAVGELVGEEAVLVDFVPETEAG